MTFTSFVLGLQQKESAITMIGCVTIADFHAIIVKRMHHLPLSSRELIRKVLCILLINYLIRKFHYRSNASTSCPHYYYQQHHFVLLADKIVNEV